MSWTISTTGCRPAASWCRRLRFWEGARRAIDEFLDRTGAHVLLVPMASGRIMVKP
jgi:hypothetical protein